MNSRYLHLPIRQLRDQYVRNVPVAERLAVVDRAEKLLGELELDRTYAYQYLYRRVTNSRAATHGDGQLTGQDASHDLQLLVQDLSGSANVPAHAAGERVLTVQGLARELNVSTKTISRWRLQGLVGRRFVFDDRKRIGFLQSSVDRFVRRNLIRVQRGAQFSQLTLGQREEIIEEARRLAQEGCFPAEVTKRLAHRTGRSLETIRYTLKRYDREHPESAVFPEHYGPLRAETKRKVYQQFRRGESIEALAKRFRRTKSSIRRIIADCRLQRIHELPLSYVFHEHFVRAQVDKRQQREILASMPLGESLSEGSDPPSGLPPYLASLYEVPLLSREQETHLFRKMNYLKYCACQLREKLDPQRPRNGLMDRIESLYDEAVGIKNQIIRSNLRLVVSIAKRHSAPRENFFELVSDGNMSLIRAVERFDFARGNKFSTYASWAIMKNFTRSIPEAYRLHDRFRTSHGDMFALTADVRTDQHELETNQQRREAQVQRLLRCLDDREQKIIARRFGLRSGQEPLTLKQVGAVMGVTKERIRQLEARALVKLREAAALENISYGE